MRRLVLSLDPGETTGWSLWEYDALTPLRLIEYGMIPGGLQGLLKWWAQSFPAQRFRTYGGELVAEDFVLDGRTLLPNTTPLEILGALEVLWPGYVRQRNVMKAHVPDAMLKHLGLWWRGAGHDRDSARHAIAYMKVKRHDPTLRWISGRAYDDGLYDAEIASITPIDRARKGAA